jgi:hypothetical protein
MADLQLVMDLACAFDMDEVCALAANFRAALTSHDKLAVLAHHHHLLSTVKNFTIRHG